MNGFSRTRVDTEVKRGNGLVKGHTVESLPLFLAA